MRFVAEKVAIGQFLIRALRLHLSVILPQFSILIFNDMLFVPGGSAWEAWEPPNKEMVFQISRIVEQKIASTILQLGRVKGITRYIVILKECRIFASCLKESRAPINSKLHSRFCKMSPSYAYPLESHAPIVFLSRKWAFIGSGEVCIHTSLLHTVCGSLNHICLLHFNDNRSWIMYDWTGIHLVLLRFLVLCQCVSLRLWTLLGGTNTVTLQLSPDKDNHRLITSACWGKVQVT
jgi:hypothetical protein